MKKILVSLLIVLVLLFSVYKLLNQKEFMFSEKSPDGNYAIEVYTYKRFFAAPGDGGVGSREAQVVLLNKNRDKLGDSNEKCSSFYQDIEIEWDLQENTVWFAKARAFDLKTGKCD